MEHGLSLLGVTSPRVGLGCALSLHDLIARFEDICMGTRGRMRRLNRYLMGCDLILFVTPDPLRADAELRLTQVALRAVCWRTSDLTLPALIRLGLKKRTPPCTHLSP
jgi:hypothetical protein